MEFPVFFFITRKTEPRLLIENPRRTIFHHCPCGFAGERPSYARIRFDGSINPSGREPVGRETIL